MTRPSAPVSASRRVPARPAGVSGSAPKVAADLAHLVVPLERLERLPGNPRRGDVDAVVRSYRRFGQRKPLVVRRTGGTKAAPRGVVSAGNHQLDAAHVLGWWGLAVVWTDDDERTAKAFALADNRTSELGSNDDEALLAMLRDVSADAELLEAASYSQALLDELAGKTDVPPGRTDPDAVPGLAGKVLSRTGDVWELGDHRLAVGDARDAGIWEALLGDERVDLVWTDPPYGVDYEGKTKHKLTIGNDGRDPVALEALLGVVFGMALGVCRPGGCWYVAGPGSGPMAVVFGRVLGDLGVWRQSLVWVKDRFVLGRSDYHYRHEAVSYGWVPGDDPPELPAAEYDVAHDEVLYGWAPGGAHRPPPDRRQDTVWEIPRPAANREHPTMKPVELVARALRNSCPPAGLVLDPFAGSGTTLIACHRERVRARVIEMDARYADVICRRWQDHTGVLPVRAGRRVDFG